MPGLFSSWKPRFRTRKTSDSERSLTNSSVPSFLHNFSSMPSTSPIPKRFNKRMVHFHENGLINNRDGTADWQHIDNKKAPLASGELDEAKDEARKNDNQFLELSSSSQQQQQQQQQQQPERQQQQQQQQLLQQQQRQQQQQQQQPEQQVNDNLKETKSDDDIHLNDNQSITGRSFGVVYLEFNDEVKRALLPPSVRSIDTIRALFLRSFPQLTSQYLSLPYVKIYIQEPSKGQLFYELDDLRDIKDQAVLKLREQLNGYQTTQSNRFVSNHSSFDYLSESEIDLMDYRNRVPTHRYRPASALDSRMLSATGTIKSTRSPISPRYDPYCDPYASDTSSQERSGSVTPVIDKEARFRMESMERQLAGLSSLVHSALISKGMSETSQRDMQELRKQILALHPDVASIASESSLPSTDPSLMDSVFLSGETQQQILKFKRHITEIQSQLKQIRRTVQMNTQASRDILREAFDRVHQYVADHLGATPHHTLAHANDTLKSEHIAEIANLQKSLQTFEENVEEVRHLVLNTNRKLRMSEVETFTETLTKLGRNAAKLK
uniref:AIP3 domain-containing protein n=1 Tax=Loa loa TaxID=7209 RepID=A0A1I7VV54_LOALO